MYGAVNKEKECFCFYRNRRRAKYEEVRQNNDNIDLTAINKSKVVLVNDLNAYCVQHHANSDHGFQQEFEVCNFFSLNLIENILRKIFNVLSTSGRQTSDSFSSQF